MTFVGKVLIVVIMVLSVCVAAFTGGAYTFQQSWKTVAERAKADTALELKEKDKAIAAHQADQKKWKVLEEDLKNRSETAEGKLGNEQQEVARLRAANEKLVLEAQNASALHDRVADEAAARRREADTLRRYLKEVHAKVTDLSKQLASLEDQKFQKELTIKEINKKHTLLLEELALAKTLLSFNNIPFDRKELVGKQSPPPDVRGKVLDARREGGKGVQLVLISLGEDDGIVRGHKLFVTRDTGKGKFMGEITIVLTRSDSAVGTVVARSKNGIIERGDNVSTRL